MTKNKGFTLIELLVVISLIGLLSSVVLASLSSAKAKARDAKRRIDLTQLAIANDAYYVSEGNGSYVATTGYLSNTTQYGGDNGAFSVLIPSYINSLQNDPLYPTVNGYIYFVKNWSGCSGTDINRYGFYARLEAITSSDPNYISPTVGDSFDKCVATNWLVNYRVGN